MKYVWVIKTLHNAGPRGITLADINEKWRDYTDLSRGEELPRQTFNRWKNELQEVFGVMRMRAQGWLPLLYLES